MLTKGLPDLGQPLPFLTYFTAISEVREKDSMRLRTPILSLLNENYSTMAPMCFRVTWAVPQERESWLIKLEIGSYVVQVTDF